MKPASDSNRSLSERALVSSSDLVTKILDLAGDAIICIDEVQRISLFNQSAEKIFGYLAVEICGQRLDILFSEMLGKARKRHNKEFSKSSLPARGIRARRKDGTEFPAEASISKVQVEGQTMFTLIVRDITERILDDERIAASLREKESLLKEVHHRVKNNLQVVSSLLGLQSRSVADPEMRNMFQESQDRVHSIALLHESLYQSHNLSQINFPEYIRRLGAHLFHSYGVGAERIHLRTDLDELLLHLDEAVPCGLIINELVSNSLKYAFPGGREGEIRIQLRGLSDGTTRLAVADNGIGLKADVDWANARSLGLRLVRTLAQQLGAEIEVNSREGLEVQLAFAAAA